MNDIDLLKRAAKAAGYSEHGVINGRLILNFGDGMRGEWNPLEDSGAALDLAVKLRLNLNFEDWDSVEYACAVPHKSHQGQDEVIADDESAAARRAIVRAAAAMAPKAPEVAK